MSKFSAVVRVVGVGVHIRLDVTWGLWVGVEGVLAGEPAARYEAAAGPSEPPGVGGKGEVAARLEFTAPIQRMFTATMMGPGSLWVEPLASSELVLGPRLTSRPEMRAGLNWLVE